MKLYVAGGCSEYGRNCFVFTEDNISICVDCGIKAEKNQKYPIITKEKIQSIKYLFLTHSHKDHSGSIPWLMQNGFAGKIITTRETASQLNLSEEDLIVINDNHKELESIHLCEDLSVVWGYNGHCVGSVWFYITFAGKKICCSGDYSEKSLAYKCDNLRNIKADIAILDCAYINDANTFEINKIKLLSLIEEELKLGKNIIMPLPKYGRAADIIALLENVKTKHRIVLDSELIGQVNNYENEKQWFAIDIYEGKHLYKNVQCKNDGSKYVYLLADAQLTKMCNKKFIKRMETRKHSIIFT